MIRPTAVGEWRGHRRFVYSLETIQHVVGRSERRRQLELPPGDECRTCDWHGAGVEAFYVRLTDAERAPDPLARKVQSGLGAWAAPDAVGLKCYWDRGWRDTAFDRQRAAARKGLAPLVFGRVAIWLGGETAYTLGAGGGVRPVGFGILMEATRPPGDDPTGQTPTDGLVDLSRRGLRQGDMHPANLAWSDRLQRYLCIDWGPCGGGPRRAVQTAPLPPGQSLKDACGRCGRGHAPE